MTKETTEDVLNEMRRTFKRDYEEINRQSNMRYDGKSIDEVAVSIEEFRQAGIAEINKIYGK